MFSCGDVEGTEAQVMTHQETKTLNKTSASVTISNAPKQMHLDVSPKTYL